MKSTASIIALTIVILSTNIALQVAVNGEDSPLRKSVANFSLPGANQSTVSLPEKAPAVVICFLGTECPLARQYAPRLQRLADRYAAQGVVFIGVDSNLQDSLAEVSQFCQANNIRMPIGMDYDQQVSVTLGATRTPEVFVLDSRRAVRYQGRIDDQYLPGITKPQAAVSELVEALDAILRDEPVRVTRTQAVGCLIGKAHRSVNSDTSSAANKVTYTGQIAKVFQTHCIECHRSGEIGPFAMTDYEELRGWGDMIIEVINDGRMPPWHAAPGHAKLRNARSMHESDKQLVRDWVASGMPYGEASQLPTTPEVKSQWQLPRSPDLEVVMRKTAYPVPAEGTVDYQYFVVDPGLTEDRWVSAAQVIPGNPSVVHHAIVFIRPPDGVDFRGVSWLTAYVPGQRQHTLPAGSARRIPAGSKFVFQMHYTPNGTPQTDQTKVGMLFVEPDQVKHEVITMMAINQEFEIPPQVADHPVTAKLKRLPKGGQLLAVSPHMHVRGRSFQLLMKQAGQEQTLLDVPRYDFNWQHTYELAEPLALDTIESLEFIARFDNSTGNPVNPNPNTLVTWGDQTWEEMAVAFFEVSQPLVNASEELSASTSKETPADRDAQAAKFADEFLAKLDLNRDGFVHYDEAPLSIQRYSFGRFDHNQDRKIDRQELLRSR
ncbi:MAG: redoxin domain-containing protein [Pirellulaceae bacterium]|nr:redoxin domain-containing protein [Pirellulaceae bacterium]